MLSRGDRAWGLEHVVHRSLVGGLEDEGRGPLSWKSHGSSNPGPRLRVRRGQSAW